MGKITLKQLSSLEKVFIEEEPKGMEYFTASALMTEEFSYQIAYTYNEDGKASVNIIVDSPISEYIMIRKVGNVPSEFPAYPNCNDEDYLSLKAGLFPDVLYPIKNNSVEAVNKKYYSIWVSVDVNKRIKAGNYKNKIIFENKELGICENKVFELKILNCVLPEQKLIYTQWFYLDCIASIHKVEIFSEKHWELIEKYIKTATQNGINMILTPIFTPPLDTAVGGERPTVQLVDVFKKGDTYSFEFSKLLKFINICKKNGIKYFEISHLFTQWGAGATPKIVAYEEGEAVRIFGWDIEASSEMYEKFLNQFLPKLVKLLKEKEIQAYFHVSDEPHLEHFKSYMACKNIISKHLGDYKIIDALSDYEFYERGTVDIPIPSTNHIHKFIENGVTNLWTYYCCSQAVGVSNRFFAMPSYRNRIIAMQFYKYNIKGFLHWGYNFYYSQFSKEVINPFLTTDAGCAFPSGDAFSVYPYEDGPIESITLKVFSEALQDLRAMELLEQYIGKTAVMELIEDEVLITFDCYPRNAVYILKLREKINNKLAEFIH